MNYMIFGKNKTIILDDDNDPETMRLLYEFLWGFKAHFIILKHGK